ncbi:hypothetical protein BJX68DRAFT_49025 [Aspergillus pseudodeflectus]|uniref:Uncharacterized protein n=1 Tax=Aspergillus pseudodeflectus TaxID=176178 RepID=A0ABR4KL69_9EURO
MSLIQVGASCAFYTIYHSAYLVAPTVALSCPWPSRMALSKRPCQRVRCTGDPRASRQTIGFRRLILLSATIN